MEWNGMDLSGWDGCGGWVGKGRMENVKKLKEGKGKYERNMSLPMPRFESPPKRPTQTGKLEIGKG